MFRETRFGKSVTDKNPPKTSILFSLPPWKFCFLFEEVRVYMQSNHIDAPSSEWRENTAISRGLTKKTVHGSCAY